MNHSKQNYFKRFASAFIILSALTMVAPPPASAMSFKLDEIGYHPAAPKVVLLEDVPEGLINEKSFKVLLLSNDKKDQTIFRKEKVVFEAKPIAEYPDTSKPGPITTKVLLDFSDFNTPGTYFFRIEGTEVTSQPIKINEYLYWDNLKPVVRTFFLQRCGQSVTDNLVTGIKHGVCHTQDAKLMDQTDKTKLVKVLDVAGGWHDSSDYSKHTTSTSLAAAKLLSMYEWNPKPFQFFTLDYPVTEPGMGNMPDLLHEIEAGLDWLMVMQRNDGGFYRKVSGKALPGLIKPEYDNQDRYVSEVTPQDTASASATLAIAARNFKKKDLSFGVKSLIAAERGWAYLEAHNIPGSAKLNLTTPPEEGRDYYNSASGANALPYKLWAAAELFLATKKPKYHQFFLANLNKVAVEPVSWRNPALMGMVDYVIYGGDSRDAKADALIREKLTEVADGQIQRMSQNPYSLGIRQFSEGSNIEVVEQSSLFLAAYRITGEEKYRSAATREMHYLFGMNPFGQTFVTGIGSHPVQHPHNRLAQATKKQIPGLLVGGPNADSKDTKTPAGLAMLSYVDDAQAFDVNDSTILYNASLAYILSTLNASYNSSPATDSGK